MITSLVPGCSTCNFTWTQFETGGKLGSFCYIWRGKNRFQPASNNSSPRGLHINRMQKAERNCAARFSSGVLKNAGNAFDRCVTRYIARVPQSNVVRLLMRLDMNEQRQQVGPLLLSNACKIVQENRHIWEPSEWSENVTREREICEWLAQWHVSVSCCCRWFFLLEREDTDEMWANSLRHS